MASLLALSSPSPSTTTPILHYPSSSFKGNVRTLKPIPTPFPSINLFHQKTRAKSPVIVLNSVASAVQESSTTTQNVRFRLNNLGPQPGSRKKAKRKGRGHAAGQGGSCGFGMRGQKSRSGPGVRKGFEGGQMPLYRRIPKLRGIAGGMHAGLPKYVPVNLKDIETAGFLEGEEVSLESLKKKGLINPSGRERRLPLKLIVNNPSKSAKHFAQSKDLLETTTSSPAASCVGTSNLLKLQNYNWILGDGELSVKLNFKARAFSTSAKEKLEAAGCSLTVLPGRKKWVKPSVAKNLARAEEYFAKKRAAANLSDSASA